MPIDAFWSALEGSRSCKVSRVYGLARSGKERVDGVGWTRCLMVVWWWKCLDGYVFGSSGDGIGGEGLKLERWWWDRLDGVKWCRRVNGGGERGKEQTCSTNQAVKGREAEWRLSIQRKETNAQCSEFWLKRKTFTMAKGPYLYYSNQGLNDPNLRNKWQDKVKDYINYIDHVWIWNGFSHLMPNILFECSLNAEDRDLVWNDRVHPMVERWRTLNAISGFCWSRWSENACSSLGSLSLCLEWTRWIIEFTAFAILFARARVMGPSSRALKACSSSFWLRRLGWIASHGYLVISL